MYLSPSFFEITVLQYFTFRQILEIIEKEISNSTEAEEILSYFFWFVVFDFK